MQAKEGDPMRDLKSIPTRVSELRVPNPGRRYFEGGDRRPFRDGRDFDLIRAWWMLEASFLSYLPNRDRVRADFASVGFRSCRFVEAGDLRGVLALGAGRALLVFRGTLVTSRSNLLTDADLRLVPAASGPGRVHRGFRNAYREISAPLEEACRRLPPGTKLYLCGHSLGGALAVLASASLREATATYTFGAPRIGDRDFVEHLPPAARYRVVNEHDIVCQLPPGPVYRHVGAPRLVTGSGDLLSGDAADLSFGERFQRILRGRLPRLWSLRDDLRALRHELLRENVVSDHAPASYAARLWNAATP